MINLFQFFKNNKDKSFTIVELKNYGIETNRTELRELVRKGFVVKNESFLHNTIKKDINGKLQNGTMMYKYSLA